MLMTMKDYEPREALFEAMGMAYAMEKLAKEESVKDVLEDIKHRIEWVLKNATIYKKMEVNKDE